MSKDMKPYLIDPFVRFIYVHMKEHKENRNIIKLDQECGSCLVYITGKWEELPDTEAIPHLIHKYFMEYDISILKQYNDITPTTPASEVGSLINKVELAELFRKGNSSYIIQLYEFISVMLEDIGREFYPERFFENKNVELLYATQVPSL